MKLVLFVYWLSGILWWPTTAAPLKQKTTKTKGGSVLELDADSIEATAGLHAMLVSPGAGHFAANTHATTLSVRRLFNSLRRGVATAKSSRPNGPRPHCDSSGKWRSHQSTDR